MQKTVEFRSVRNGIIWCQADDGTLEPLCSNHDRMAEPVISHHVIPIVQSYMPVACMNRALVIPALGIPKSCVFLFVARK